MENKKKKFILFIQGEGRGHMTQAISLYDILIAEGHEVCAAVIGASSRREIPEFIFRNLKTEIIRLESPNFVTDHKNKGIKIGPSVFHNLGKLGTFRKSLREIHALLNKHKPDAVINFFDPLIGLYYSFYKCTIPHICIAHQYIYLHKEFRFPRGKFADRAAIKWFTGLTSVKASKRLAISFYNMPTQQKENVVVVPPLLRKELFELQPEKKEFFLIYLVNNGYLEDIIKWHKRHPDVELHCFTDKNGLPEMNGVNDNFHFHQLDDKKFLDMMATAKGLVSTAGFESVCEAMYLGKPVLMVPVQGHFEQFCNSRDAFHAGAGIYDERFNIQSLLRFSSFSHQPNLGFKNWVNKASSIIYKEVCSAIN